MKRQHRKAKTKAKARPKPTARKQLQILKDGVASAVKQLNMAHEDLGEVDAFVFVCLVALRDKGGNDVGPSVVTVLSAAYDKLVLDVNQSIRDALEALDQDGAQ
jgi:hypothetical protein